MLSGRNWWRIGGGAAIVAGLVLMLLGAGRSDADLGGIFRQMWTGLAVAALGFAALYADQKEEAHERDQG